MIMEDVIDGEILMIGNKNTYNESFSIRVDNYKIAVRIKKKYTSFDFALK